MDYLMGGLSSIVSIASFVIFIAGVMKLFQIASSLNEIKDLLSAIKLNGSIHLPASAPIVTPTVLASTQSGEEMLRALSMELDQPVNPTSIELGHKS